MALQWHQLFNLILLSALSISLGSWGLSLWQTAGLIALAVAIEAIRAHLQDRPLSPSAVVTALGVVLVGFSTHTAGYVFALVMALGQKAVLTYRGKHLFNPSNFAVVTAVGILEGSFFLKSGHLGDDVLWLYGVWALGVWVLFRANRLWVALGFIGVYIPIGYLVQSYVDATLHWQSYWQGFYSVAFSVFVLFMLTDPVTTPAKPRLQLLFGSATALVALGLDFVIAPRMAHLFGALFVVSALYGLVFRKPKAHSEALKALVLLVLTAGMVGLFLQNSRHIAGYDL